MTRERPERGVATMPWRTDAGATAVEYGILLALVAAVIVASVRVLGAAVTELFNSAVGTF